MNWVGILTVKVVSATGLPAMDLAGKSDPYVKVTFGDRSFKTPVLKHTLNPVWIPTTTTSTTSTTTATPSTSSTAASLSTFKFVVSETADKNGYTVMLDVFDWDRQTHDDYIGSAEILPSSFLSTSSEDCGGGGGVRKTVALADLKQQHTTAKKHKSYGEITVELSLMKREMCEREFWKGLAKHFDNNSSGVIEELELGMMLDALHSSISNQEIAAVLKEIDVGQDKAISWQELYDWSKKNPANILRLTGGTSDIIWKTWLISDSVEDLGSSLLADANDEEANPQGVAVPLTTEAEGALHILVRDRRTGHVSEEAIGKSLKVAMRLMYSLWGGRQAVSATRAKQILQHLTEMQGRHYDDPKSVHEIPKFVALHNISMEESLTPLEEFKTYNEFFYRKLKPGSRPVDPEASVVSAADCRLTAYQSITTATHLWIKGKDFTVGHLLQDPGVAGRYGNGASVVIFRLSPQDYHRFHSPISGTVATSAPLQIPGALYTVNPIAVRENIDVFGENKRAVTWIDADDKRLGRMAFVAVGATCVGSINFTVKPGQHVNKGDEMGYFAFGGSTVVVLFEPGTITIDSDLLENSLKPIETLVKVGYSVARTASE